MPRRNKASDAVDAVHLFLQELERRIAGSQLQFTVQRLQHGCPPPGFRLERVHDSNACILHTPRNGSVSVSLKDMNNACQTVLQEFHHEHLTRSTHRQCMHALGYKLSSSGSTESETAPAIIPEKWSDVRSVSQRVALILDYIYRLGHAGCRNVERLQKEAELLLSLPPQSDEIHVQLRNGRIHSLHYTKSHIPTVELE